jgi:prepilin-type N-terminal cleavage/methylation domain-containing protein
MKRNYQNQGFTIVELLTVMAVIAMLIGLLVPALNLVMGYAKKVKQQAQLHSISVALEMVKQTEGDYPDSAEIWPAGGKAIEGAQRLAEALVGRDLQGFDPVSRWHPALDGQAPISNAYSTDTTTTPTEKQKSLERRKGPYVNLENIGAFNIDQLYPNTAKNRISNIYGYTDTATPANNDPAPFITDVFTDRAVTLTLTTTTGTITKTVKAGTPILYYKANPTNKDLQKVSGTNVLSTRTYNYYDNQEILAMGRMMTESTPRVTTITDPGFHPLSADPIGNGTYLKFYDTISNPQVPSNEGVPYKADTFILMSAGKDGLFGTTDDVRNFGD